MNGERSVAFALGMDLGLKALQGAEAGPSGQSCSGAGALLPLTCSFDDRSFRKHAYFPGRF